MIHGRSTYMKDNCRCEICVAAAKLYRDEYRRAKDPGVYMYMDPQPFIDRLTRDGMIDRVSRGTRRAWAKNGISIYRADYWCIKYGYHPAQIFGNAFYEGCFPEEAAS